ncbi:MAG: trehalose-6-phosphate synthase [Candidatus Competibacteraceae bacterium]
MIDKTPATKTAMSKPADSLEPLIVIASNRGPFSFKKAEDSGFTVQRGAGGLVTALGALAERHRVLWVAAALSRDDRDWAEQQGGKPQDVEGILLQLFQPDPAAYEKYYNHISNPLLWFIQHQLWDTPRYPSIDGDTWDAWYGGYVAVNRQCAETIAAGVGDGEQPILILPQDYQLYLVPHFLREQLGERVQIQPFCHIPWPGPDAWRILPAEMRAMLLSSLLDSDRVGFQTQKDAFNFVQTCRFYLSDAHSRGSRTTIHYRDRKIEAKAYPISIDVEKVEAIAEEMETKLFKNQLIQSIGDSRLILRTDRVEPSKNILRSLQAFRVLLDNYPEHRGKVQMLTLLVPSRMEVDEYQTYLKEITAEASLINADFSDGFWEPVRMIFGSNYNRAIAAMQLYDVLMVNPLADGMNLVAKEGVLVNQRDGVLLLSEFAGAYYELGDQALTVSPFDIHSTAETLHQALVMPAEERGQRAEALREQVRNASVKLWFQTQVDDALKGLKQS